MSSQWSRATISSMYFKLHDLAMDVVNHGKEGRASALFDLAIEIEDQLSDLSEALENILGTIPN